MQVALLVLDDDLYRNTEDTVDPNAPNGQYCVS